MHLSSLFCIFFPVLNETHIRYWDVSDHGCWYAVLVIVHELAVHDPILVISLHNSISCNCLFVLLANVQVDRHRGSGNYEWTRDTTVVPVLCLLKLHPFEMGIGATLKAHEDTSVRALKKV